MYLVDDGDVALDVDWLAVMVELEVSSFLAVRFLSIIRALGVSIPSFHGSMPSDPSQMSPFGDG